MEQKKSKTIRLTGLDGLRGFAILLVFLTHINAEPILEKLPSSIRVIGETIFSSGVTGVSILFILCGFLMAYLYLEPKSAADFLQRRYTRIFPLFLSMSSAMAIIRINHVLSPLFQLGIIFGIAVVVHFIWKIIRKVNSSLLSRLLFYFFIGLQLAVGCWYALYIMRKPPVVFNTQMPKLFHDSTVWLVNSTLTLPLGNYIPMLDGVYWSLASEVLFYILYPILFVPFILSFTNKKLFIKGLFVLSLIPLFIGIDQLSHRILDLSMMQVPLFYYFITGIILALLYHKKDLWQESLSNIFYPKFVKSISVVLFFIIIFFVRLNLHTVSPAFNPLIRILWAFPLTYMVFMIIDSTTSISRLFSSRFFVYLGKISYSLYLSHTIIVEIMKELYTPKSAVDVILFIVISFIFAVVVASILQYLLEQPYFTAKKEKLNATSKIVYHKHIIGLSFIVVYLFSLLIAYQSNFNFFSSEYAFRKDIVTLPKIKTDAPIRLNENPKVVLEFRSEENNLGIVALHLHYFQIQKKVKDSENWQKLQIRIKEKNAANWYATSEYSPVQIGDSETMPFGFPVITDSKNKTYIVELQLLNPKSNVSIEVKTVPFIASAVSQMDKKNLVKHPNLLVSHVSRRLQNVFLDPNAQKATIFAVPAFFLLIAI